MSIHRYSKFAIQHTCWYIAEICWSTMLYINIIISDDLPSPSHGYLTVHSPRLSQYMIYIHSNMPTKFVASSHSLGSVMVESTTPSIDALIEDYQGRALIPNTSWVVIGLPKSTDLHMLSESCKCCPWQCWKKLSINGTLKLGLCIVLHCDTITLRQY